MFRYGLLIGIVKWVGIGGQIHKKNNSLFFLLIFKHRSKLFANQGAKRLDYKI